MDPAWEERKRWFLRYCPLTNRPAAESAVSRLLEFTERMSEAVKLDESEPEQPSIAFLLTNRKKQLWKAYVKDDKVEFLTRWPKTLSRDEQQAFLDLWERITRRRLPIGGKGSVAMLRFKAVGDDRFWPRIEQLLEWACTLRS